MSKGATTMPLTLRTIVITAFPTLVTILGYLWWTNKKKELELPPKKKESDPKQSGDKPSPSVEKAEPASKSVPAHSLLQEQVPFCSQLQGGPGDFRKEPSPEVISRPVDEPKLPTKAESEVCAHIQSTPKINTPSENAGKVEEPCIPAQLVSSDDQQESVQNEVIEPVAADEAAVPQECVAQTTAEAASPSQEKEERVTEDAIVPEVEVEVASKPQSVNEGAETKEVPLPAEEKEDDRVVEEAEVKQEKEQVAEVDQVEDASEDMEISESRTLEQESESEEGASDESAGPGGEEVEESVSAQDSNDNVDSLTESVETAEQSGAIEEAVVEVNTNSNAQDNEQVNGQITENAVDAAESEDKSEATPEEPKESNGIEKEICEVTDAAASDQTFSSVPSSVSSPVETTFANGSNGCHSDAQSEVSADSGNCSTIVETSVQSNGKPSRSEPTTFQFNFPSELCGMLIGRSGRNIRDLKDRAGCEITVKDKLYTGDCKLIVLEGTRRQVDRALDLIKRRFPPFKYPNIDFSAAEPEKSVLTPEIMQLSLPDAVCVDVNVSSVVTPNHLFLQQPTHPSFYMLEKQNACMLMCYAQDSLVPQLPRPLEVGVICAAPMLGGWYRAQVVSVAEDGDECDIKFVDYGGYMHTQGCVLRQIRSDFTALPFQAVECYLANVIPPKESGVFPAEGASVLEELVHGQLLQAEVVGYEEDGVPYIHLYYINAADNTLQLINRELVNRGVAKWLEHEL